MKQRIFNGSLILALMAMAVMTGWAQQQQPASPPAKAEGKIGAVSVTIDYSSPGVKGRKIFGGLEPYGKPWRAGANQATTLTIDKDVTIAGTRVPAGKYTIFMTPGETEWSIIINSQTGQWGITRGGANFDPANNVAVATVKPSKTPELVERLRYEVRPQGIAMLWENTEVVLPVSEAK